MYYMVTKHKDKYYKSCHYIVKQSNKTLGNESVNVWQKQKRANFFCLKKRSESTYSLKIDKSLSEEVFELRQLHTTEEQQIKYLVTLSQVESFLNVLKSSFTEWV